MFGRSLIILPLLVMAFSILGSASAEEQELRQKSSSLQSFLEIPFSVEDGIIIKEVLETMIYTDLDQLLDDLNIIVKAKERLEGIPPLKLLAFIASDPYVSRLIKTIEPTNIKYHFALAWVDHTLRNSEDLDLFFLQLSGLSEFLNLDKHMIQSYAGKEDFRSLVKQVLYPPSPDINLLYITSKN